MPSKTPKLHVSRHVNIRGLRIHYLESSLEQSPSSGPPLIFLVGWPTASALYVPLLHLIAPHNKCYVVDLPGYGGSESDMNVYSGFDYYLDFLRIFHMDVVGSGPVHLFGYSTGGVHAINYAHKHPESVCSLTVFSVPYDGIEQFAAMEKNSASRLKMMRKLHPFFTRHKNLIKLINARPVKIIAIAFFYVVIYTRLYPQMLKKVRKRHLFRSLYKTSQFNIKSIFDLAIDLSMNSFTHVAQLVHTPTLVLSAQNDTAVLPERSSRLAGLMPGATYECIPDADHAVGITDPQKIFISLGRHLRGFHTR